MTTLATPALGPAIALFAVLAAFGAGCVKAGAARRPGGKTTIAWFCAGWALLSIALLSPLHTAADTVLTAHMAQHALILIAPIGLVLGRTGTRVLQGLAPSYRGVVARRLRRAGRLGNTTWAPATVLIGVTVGWHMPFAFELAAADPVVHAVEHVSLIGAATFFWASVGGERMARRSGHGAAVASMVAVFIVGSVGGSVISFSPIPLYPVYAQASPNWQVDQQVAGVVMTVPMGMVVMAMVAWTAYRWAGSVGLAQRASSTSSATVANKAAR